jgi:Uma2 family endonuclease
MPTITTREHRRAQWSRRCTALLGGFITVHVAQHNLGYTTSAETGFCIGANDYIPDLAFIAASQRPHPLGETWITVVPDLVLEVKSPTDTYIGLVRKAADYVASGVRIVWVVLPDKRRVEVYTTDNHLSVGEDGLLDGGAVLPGFTFKVADLFAKLR